MAAINRKQSLVMLVFFFMIIAIQDHVEGDPKAPCYFIFGDSLSDSGNNNALFTFSKADFLPYGIDFPQGATGRFTNGRTLMDYLTEHIGVDRYIPPYHKAEGRSILKGVNYASGGSGILETSTHIQMGRIWLSKQVENHAEIITRISSFTGKTESALHEQHLSKCIYTVAIGSNDYINNYYTPENNPIIQLYTPERFADLLRREMKRNLKRLYSFGARKIVVVGLTGIGCCPHVAKKFKGKPCSEKVNSEVQLFNDKLLLTVNTINRKLREAKFTFLNITPIFNTILPEGSVKPIGTCCKLVEATGMCAPHHTPCTNRSEYVFFDGFHPTESSNKILADQAYTAKSPQVISPYTFKQLLEP